MVTIKDIADKARVSQTTVSRILNHDEVPFTRILPKRSLKILITYASDWLSKKKLKKKDIKTLS